MKNLLQKTHLRALMLVALICAGLTSAWGETETYTLTPNQESTGSKATSYITTLTEFTYNDISWKMNQWNPKTLQIRTNQSSAASEFRFYNTSAFPGKIKQVVIKFHTITVSDASKFMFIGGTSAVTATTGGTAGTFNSSKTTLTWTPADTDDFYYFAFYQNGKAASGTNFLKDADAITVTYEAIEPSDFTLANAPVALTFDLYNNSAAQTINYTTSSTGAITISESEYVTASVDETNKTITVTPIAVTPSAQTITINQATDGSYAAGSATFTVSIDDSTPKPKHTVTFYQNGTKISDAEISEDDDITFPEDPTDIEGKKFMGWTTAEIEGEQNEAPAVLVKTAIMGNDDISYYAVFATQESVSSTTTIEDVLNRGTTDVEGTSYVDWSGKKANTDAVYAGQSAGGNESIQLRSNNNNSGIITTTSGGKAKKVTVVWNSNTASGRTLNVYGNNTAYHAATDLYGDNAGTLLGTIVNGTSTEFTITDDYAYIGLRSNNGAMYLDNISITWETGTPATYSAYCTTVSAPVELAAPIIFHDGGEYESALTVAIAGEGTIKYTLNGGAEQTYSAPVNVNETTTITAWTEADGAKSSEVSKTFTITTSTAGPAVADKYYTIKNKGNNKYVQVADRKTVAFAEGTDDAGTVIRVKTNAEKPGQLEILRSQGVDVPSYAEKAMNYVPKIVEMIADELNAKGSGTLLGENGLDAIMAKFKASFDYHLYLEEANGGYRIYGRTPSMQPVVDFYAENKANVDVKLPALEDFINSAIEKVLEKTGGRGTSILVPFSLQTVWQNMGGTLTKPEDEASTKRFYEEVLSSETNVWNFAYETAMIYWSKLKDNATFKENVDKLGDYAKYINKVENIRPNFKYYLVQKDDQIDFISQGNGGLNEAFTTWTLAERTDFNVAFDEENLLNGKYYTTLYTDFAYTLPESVKAYKVTAINETSGVATKEEITGTIPAQTPVLLESTSAEPQALTLTTDAGTAVTGNLLVGPDYLIKTYSIKATQVEELFSMAKDLFGEDAYNTYLTEYEHLMMKNSGTVNNKYFFGLDDEDLGKCADEEGYIKVRSLGIKNNILCFFENWDVSTNKAFLVDENDPVLFSLKGDVNRDGRVDINDVTATVDMILSKATPETHADVYDFGAADANENGAITIDDVVTIVNMVLGK